MKGGRSTVGSGILLSLVSFLLTLVLLEVSLRLFFPVTDFPVAAYEAGVGLHMAPHQTGTWVVGATGEVSGDYRFNAAGWNSPHAYTTGKPEDTLRVAVIGDSFIEALQVDVEQAFPALLERKLEESRVCADYAAVEVYSFGFQGAPLAQYLSMMRHAAGRYAPDIYVIAIAHNDFEPSLSSQAPHPHFLSLRPADAGGFEEVAPVPYTPSRLRRFLIRFALVRYIYGNLKLPDMLPDLRTLFLRADGDAAQQLGEPVATDAPALVDMVTYIFGKFQEVAQQDDAQLLLILDADREAIYAGQPPSSEAIRYLEIVNHAAAYWGIDYIDLTAPFVEDFQEFGEPFNSGVDYHWNERGHAVVGQVVYDWLADNGCADAK